MLVSDRLRLIFYHIPKAAGTTVHRDLLSKVSDATEYWGQSEDHDLAHMSFAESRDFLEPEVISSYFKFCVVRNPYNRLYSAFKNRRDELYRQGLLENRECSFNDFILNVLTESNITQDKNFVHFRPSHLVTHENGAQVMDRVIRFENFYREYQEVLRDFELPATFSSYNIHNVGFRPFRRPKTTIVDGESLGEPVYEIANTRRLPKLEKASYLRYYSAEAIEKVNTVYRMDFDEFNYSLC